MTDRTHPNELFSPVAARPNTPPEYPTKTGEFHPFRVWCWRCFADGWICIATFSERADARVFVARQTGRSHDIYLQSPHGVERFTPEMR